MIALIILLLLIPVSGMSIDYSEIVRGVESYRQKQIEERNAIQGQSVQVQKTGYDMTAAKLLSIKHQGAMIPRRGCTAHRIGNVSPEAQHELARRFPDERQVLNQGFAIKYPGSSYDCVSGTGHIVAGYQEYVLQMGHVKRYTEKGPVTYDVFWVEGFANVMVSDGKQFVSFVLDTKKAKNSYFNDVSLSITAQAQRQAIYEGEGVSLTKNQMIEILNSYYAQHNQNGDMISFARALILDKAFREKIFTEVGGEPK